MVVYEMTKTQAHELIGAIVSGLAGDIAEAIVELDKARIVIMGRSFSQETIMIGISCSISGGNGE